MLNRTAAPKISPIHCRRLVIPQPTVLSNGIELWTISGGKDDLCRISFFNASGELQEPKPLVAILSALMIYKGNRVKKSFDISEAFDFCGAFHSSNTYNRYTENSFSCLNKNFNEIATLFVDCLSEPTFPQAELTSLKTRLVESFKVSVQNTSYLAAREMRKLCYGMQLPLGRPVNITNIRSVTRADLTNFHDLYYRSNGAKLVLSGNVDDKITDCVLRTFGSLPRQTSQTLSEPMPCRPSPKMFSVVNCKGAVQSSIRIRLYTIDNRDCDYYALRILVTVLGGYFGSRLNMAIREDSGLTYGVGAALIGGHGDSHIEISTDCDVAYTFQVIEAIKTEIVKLKESPISDEELHSVRQYVLSRQIMMLDSPFKLANYIGKTIVGNIASEHYNSLSDAIASISAKELQRVANRCLDLNKLRIVVACDKAKLKTKNHGFSF